MSINRSFNVVKLFKYNHDAVINTCVKFPCDGTSTFQTAPWHYHLHLQLELIQTLIHQGSVLKHTAPLYSVDIPNLVATLKESEELDNVQDCK